MIEQSIDDGEAYRIVLDGKKVGGVVEPCGSPPLLEGAKKSSPLLVKGATAYRIW